MSPFTCSCGMKTREPFLVGGELLCVICADKLSPRLVTKRAERNWHAFQNMNRSVPTRPGYRARWTDDD